ncbi:uncharacterized protein EV422DRAFT_528153 [Fimicolochytrium jonesii]|uniref:uncharacterized protein n=1 Tax=Fimicolochytrium jonesii TaxID=1396493 RepID=UPI0022FF3476|nr:uncharacterized protein EV422DRAFT_528153 [Fimicolochytrium jonesii]KAI8821438.1 hypothetical protein EV422DRAFT_528153 [Fimicolochytrium jonesii]
MHDNDQDSAFDVFPCTATYEPVSAELAIAEADAQNQFELDMQEYLNLETDPATGDASDVTIRQQEQPLLAPEEGYLSDPYTHHPSPSFADSRNLTDADEPPSAALGMDLLPFFPMMETFDESLNIEQESAVVDPRIFAPDATAQSRISPPVADNVLEEEEKEEEERPIIKKERASRRTQKQQPIAIPDTVTPPTPSRSTGTRPSQKKRRRVASPSPVKHVKQEQEPKAVADTVEFCYEKEDSPGMESVDHPASRDSSPDAPAQPLKPNKKKASDATSTKSRADKFSLDNIGYSLEDLRQFVEELEADDSITPKEKRQLRNKLSARNFRVRRKEYVTQLEDEVEVLRKENTSLKSSLEAKAKENEDLKRELKEFREKQGRLLNFNRDSTNPTTATSAAASTGTNSFHHMQDFRHVSQRLQVHSVRVPAPALSSSRRPSIYEEHDETAAREAATSFLDLVKRIADKDAGKDEHAVEATPELSIEAPKSVEAPKSPEPSQITEDAEDEISSLEYQIATEEETTTPHTLSTPSTTPSRTHRFATLRPQDIVRAAFESLKLGELQPIPTLDRVTDPAARAHAAHMVKQTIALAAVLTVRC